MTGSVQRVIVVTGASRGIGKAIALSLCDAGTLLYVGYRSGESEAKAVVDQITAQGGSAKLLQIDVANSASVKAAFDRVAEESGGVDVLVNNAGISIDGLMLRAKDDDWDAVVDTNLKGSFMCARAALKTMLRRPEGRIIFMSSVVGQMGNAGQAVYAASKAGLHGLTKAIAREVASRAVTVNAIAPGFIKTEMTEKLTDDQKQALLTQIPLRRWAEPEEIASIVKFLVSPNASYITGQVIAANGGMYL